MDLCEWCSRAAVSDCDTGSCDCVSSVTVTLARVTVSRCESDVAMQQSVTVTLARVTVSRLRVMQPCSSQWLWHWLVWLCLVTVTLARVTVAKATRARFTYCPNNVTAVTNSDRVAVWWRNPLVDDVVSSQPVIVSQNTSPGGIFTTGVTRVLYKTQNADGAAAYCQFYIIVLFLGLSLFSAWLKI